MAEKYQIELTPAAELDLLDIVEYLMEEVSLNVAEHVNDGILATIETLEVLPRRNPKLEFSPQHRLSSNGLTKSFTQLLKKARQYL